MAGTTIVSDENKVKVRVRIKGLRPPSSRGKLDYLFNRNRPIRLVDNYCTSWTIGLGRNFIGFHVRLRSRYGRGAERVDEILRLQSALVDMGYSYVPHGALRSLKDPVSSSLIRGSTAYSLDIDRFDAAIPLHDVREGCRSFYLWDSVLSDWKLVFPRNIQGLNVPGRNVLLIAYNPRCPRKKDVADEEEIQDEDLKELFA